MMSFWRAFAVTAVFFVVTACGEDSSETIGSGGSATSTTSTTSTTGGAGGTGGGGDLDISICDPANDNFSLTIDNPYMPMVVGTVLTLEDAAGLLLEITVLDETNDVAGITTRVLEERETENGELIEVSRNYFVQAPDGTVCYYGEDVDIYENGMITSHEGAWLAGVGRNQPGIMMPANPMVGMTYPQEIAPGVAMDRGEITKVGVPYTVPFMMYPDTVETIDTTPLEPGSESLKVYARDVGLIFDDGAELTDVTP